MDLPTSLFSLLQQASEPQTSTQLGKALPMKASPRAVTAALMQMAQAGKVTAFAQGKTTAYASRPPLDLCAESLALRLPLLQEAVAPAKLKSLLPKSLQPWFDEALGRLVVHGLAHWLPKGKSRLVQARPVKPSDVLSAGARKQLEKVLAEVNRRRRQARQMKELLAWLDADSAVATVPTAASEPGPAPEPTPTQLRNWYEADRSASSTSMIPLPQTWQRYDSWASDRGWRADPADFKQAVQSMYEADEAMLEPHERPQDLPESERLLQVPLSVGPPGYYWCPVV